MAASVEHFAELLVASSLSPQGWSTISEACSKFTGDASVGQDPGYLQIGAHDYELLSQACSVYIEQFGVDDAKRQGYAPTSTTPASQPSASKPHDHVTTSTSVSSTIVSTSNTYNYFAHSIPAYHNQSPPTPTNPYPTARNYYRASAYYPVPASPTPSPKRAPTFHRTIIRANDAPKPPLETTAGRVTPKARRFNPYSRPAPVQAPTTLPKGKFRLTGTNVLFDNADDTFRPSSLPPWKK